MLMQGSILLHGFVVLYLKPVQRGLTRAYGDGDVTQEVGKEIRENIQGCVVLAAWQMKIVVAS